MQGSEYRFFNLPIKYDRDAYKKVREGIVKKYSGANGLVSIYEWGDVSVPGISDLDIVFVFDGGKPLPFSRRSFYLNGKAARYIVRHPFVFISRESLESIGYINPDVRLSLLHGPKCRIGRPKRSELLGIKAANLNDLMIRHYPRDFFLQGRNKSINVRDTLLRLNSLCYTMDSIQGLAGRKNKGWQQTAAQIRNLRKEWFEKKDFGMLASLNGKALGISMELVGEFRQFLLKNGLVSVSGEKAVYTGQKNRSLFISGWSPSAALSQMDGKVSVLPIELAPQLFEYSKYSGGISQHIRAHLHGKIDYNAAHAGIMGKRIRVLNEQAALAVRLRHSDFAAFYDFGYRASSGINNWIIKATDLIRN